MRLFSWFKNVLVLETDCSPLPKILARHNIHYNVLDSGSNLNEFIADTYYGMSYACQGQPLASFSNTTGNDLLGKLTCK